MIQTLNILPGVTLRYCHDQRFKQSTLSIQFVRRMCREEAALNALLPAVLLRGSRTAPDLRSITLRLDDLYGASVNALVRRIGDYQTTGLYCAFIEDRYALAGDQILMPMVAFLRELLLEPVLEDGCFSRDFTEGEKRNLILAIESERNDKRAYASGKLFKHMCSEDSYGIPRLGTVPQVEAITSRSLYDHYLRILRESPVEIFYVGSASLDTVAGLILPLFSGMDRAPVSLTPQTPFRDPPAGQLEEQMETTQSILAMGFTTDVTNRSPDFAAMQLMNALFGSGMTSKLFMNVREKLSLCYSIGSGYYSSKGIVSVSAGIDAAQVDTVRQEILRQLQACRDGDITADELTAAREAVLSGLRSVMDAPGAIEGYFSTTALSGLPLTLDQYRDAVCRVTAQDIAAVAGKLKPHTEFFLKGVGA